MKHRPRVLFLGSEYAGHRTRFDCLRRNATSDGRIEPIFRTVSGWSANGFIERVPGIDRGAKGRIRALQEGAALAMLPRPDAIWLTTSAAFAPYLWAQLGPLRRPLVLDFDWTVEQREAWARSYFNRAPRTGRRLAMALWHERLLWNRSSLLVPWSRWAAGPLRRHGIDDRLIRVMPAGIDLDVYRRRRTPGSSEGPLRLLFVGGDFHRKGGDMLVDVFQRHFSDRCELDIVTRDTPPQTSGVRLHRLEANAPKLRELFQRADLFVMPSKAECFGLATIEAMASAVPVLVSNVGAAREIVDDGETGWLIAPDATSLRQALDHALDCRRHLPAMGDRGRAVAEARFDAARNDRLIVDVMIEQIEQHTRKVPVDVQTSRGDSRRATRPDGDRRSTGP